MSKLLRQVSSVSSVSSVSGGCKTSFEFAKPATCPAEASSLPSLRHTKVGIPTSVFCPKNPSPGQRRRSVSDAVLAASLTVFFPTIQSWRGHRIAPLNPGVGAGLLHSILDCPGVSQTRRDCPENSVRASLHSDALPESPPGFPPSNLASNAKEMGKIKLFPTTEYSSKQASDPVVPLVPCTGIFLGPSKSGKTVALISLILEQYRGVFENLHPQPECQHRRQLDPRQEVH